MKRSRAFKRGAWPTSLSDVRIECIRREVPSTVLHFVDVAKAVVICSARLLSSLVEHGPKVDVDASDGDSSRLRKGVPQSNQGNREMARALVRLCFRGLACSIARRGDGGTHGAHALAIRGVEVAGYATAVVRHG